MACLGNHLGYGQAKGTRATAKEITDLYEGLKESYLDDFDMMLSGYLPGAASVEAVGSMGRDLKKQECDETRQILLGIGSGNG